MKPRKESEQEVQALLRQSKLDASEPAPAGLFEKVLRDYVPGESGPARRSAFVPVLLGSVAMAAAALSVFLLLPDSGEADNATVTVSDSATKAGEPTPGLLRFEAPGSLVSELNRESDRLLDDVSYLVVSLEKRFPGVVVEE